VSTHAGHDPGKRSGAVACVQWVNPMSGPPKKYDRRGKKSDPARRGKMEPTVGPGEFACLAAFAWKLLARGCVVTDRDGHEATFAHLADVGAYIGARLPPGYTLTNEDQFIGKNATTAMILARACEAVSIGLAVGQVGETKVVNSQTWRAQVGGLAGLSAKDAAKAAIRVADWLSPGGLGALATNDHAADALCSAAGGAIARAHNRPS